MRRVGPGQLHKRVWTSSLSRTSQRDNFSESFANSLSTVNGMNKRSATSYLQSGVIFSCLFFKQMKGRGELKAGRFIKSLYIHVKFISHAILTGMFRKKIYIYLNYFRDNERRKSMATYCALNCSHSKNTLKSSAGVDSCQFYLHAERSRRHSHFCGLKPSFY